MVNGVEDSKPVRQSQSPNFTLVHTNNDIAMYFQ